MLRGILMSSPLRMTLYRMARYSQIVHALIDAADHRAGSGGACGAACPLRLPESHLLVPAACSMLGVPLLYCYDDFLALVRAELLLA